MNAFLFLDIDGVLNSSKWDRQKRAAMEIVHAEICNGGAGTAHEELLGDDETRKIDPEAIKILNEIICKSGALIVITSVWRTMYPLPVIGDIFERRGFEYPLSIIGCTHELRGSTRGDEIEAWLSRFEEERNYAILDDNNDMGNVASHLVQVDNATGLGPEHVEPLLQRLRWSF